MADPLLQIQDLRVEFQPRSRPLLGHRRVTTALQGVHLTVGRGEVVALVGESGSGKSTLARTVVGLVSPTSGRIVFDGWDISRPDRTQLRELRREMQMVFQDPYGSVNPRMRVRDIVAEPLRNYHNLSRAQLDARVGQLLETVHLFPEVAERRPTRLSGGQLQRVGIARALALEPRLLIADEPVSALDVSIQAQILSLLRELQQDRGISLLFVSHNLAVVRQVADRIAVLCEGSIVEAGAAQQVLTSPTHSYTRRLVDAVPTVTGPVGGPSMT